jgi:phosphoribosylformimino-5-aminoimidazole carboxamide ribotide isomerase
LQIIPAIDLRNGKVVRLTQGDFSKETIFSDDPIEIAKNWVSQGAERLHIVDLDGAKTGKPRNLEIVKQIIKVVDVPIQLGGGIRDLTNISQILNMGVERVIIGTSATNKSLARIIFDVFSDSIILGLDARNGLVSINGWQDTSDQYVINFAKEMESLGAKRIIYTDINSDGMFSLASIFLL